jgi:lipopolysaccharide biosynthesis glycosyltransferase
MFSVAFFSDSYALPGLHATLASMLFHSSTESFRTVVFSDNLKAREIRLLEHTVKAIAPNHRFEVRKATFKLPPQTRALRGNWTTYGRLFLPSLLPDDNACLYLDCDLVVTANVADLYAHINGSRNSIVIDGNGVRKHSLDRDLLADVGLDLDGACFNAGVMLVNLKVWRETNVHEECMDFITKYPQRLLSADQAVLNAVLHSRFGRFPPNYNIKLFPDSSPLRDPPPGIYHFVGAPKPWDYFGSFAVNNFALWYEWFARTVFYRDFRSRLSAKLPAPGNLRILPATFRRLT